MNLKSYFYIMRIGKPIGFILLWLPTAWALWLSYHGMPPSRILFLFIGGTILTRSSGCIINDIADRNIDNKVQRTKNRPLASHTITLSETFCLLLFLLFFAFIILINLPQNCFFCGLLALLISILYPFSKRFFQAPQIILSLAFSMGIPMAFLASHTPFNNTMWVLLLINILWIVAYDTQYAMIDRKDDVQIGINSTAILFASYDIKIITTLHIILHLLWLLLMKQVNHIPIFIGTWIMAAFQLKYQYHLIIKRQENDYLKAFISNSWYGCIMWLGLL